MGRWPRQTKKMRGGAKKVIADLLPDVTSAAEFAEKTTALYITPHGETKLNTMMIVPENTFIIFIGQSGFQVLVAHGADWLFSEASREAYFKNLYDIYVTGRASVPARPYAHEHVYVPGDILPDTEISFRSGEQTWYTKGVYECPVRNKEDFKIDDPKKKYMLQLAEMDKQGLLERGPDDIPIVFHEAGFDKTRTASWKIFRDTSLEVRTRMYRDETDGSHTYFKDHRNPSGIQEKVSNPKLITHPDELLGRDWILSKNYTTSVSEILERVNPHPEKKYRFVIVSACRGAMPGATIAAGELHPHPNPMFMKNYGNIQPARLARRFSFSAKAPNLPPEPTGGAAGGASSAAAETSEGLCALYDDAPMNLKKALEAFKPLRTTMSRFAEEDPEWDFLVEVQSCFFTTDNPPTYETRFPAENFGIILNMLFYPFPVLSNPGHSLHAPFKNLVNTLQTTFGTFLLGLHVDKVKKDEIRSLGESLLRHRTFTSYTGNLVGVPANKLKFFPKTTNTTPYAQILPAQRNFLERPNWAHYKKATGEIPVEQADQKWLNDLLNGIITYRFDTSLSLAKWAKAILALALVPQLREVFEDQPTETLESVTLKLQQLNMISDTLNRAIAEYNVAIDEFEAKKAEILSKYSESGMINMRTVKVRIDNTEREIRKVKGESEAALRNIQRRKAELEEMKAEFEAAAVAPPPVVQAAPVQPTPAQAAPANNLLAWRAGWNVGNRNPATNEQMLLKWRHTRQNMTPNARKAQNRNIKARAKALRNSRRAATSGGRRKTQKKNKRY